MGMKQQDVRKYAYMLLNKILMRDYDELTKEEEEIFKIVSSTTGAKRRDIYEHRVTDH